MNGRARHGTSAGQWKRSFAQKALFLPVSPETGRLLYSCSCVAESLARTLGISTATRLASAPSAMSNWFWLALPCLVLLAFRFALRRANELFALTAHAGKLELVRGRLSPALFSEFAEIAARERLNSAELRVLSEGGSPRLVLRGEPKPAAEQALRNVLGRYPVSHIRAGRLRAR